MKILVGMSGGVDSSVASALLLEAGHDVVGATMKLWGGVSDSGCCSVADVEDARRVAHQLGITHHVFNFGDQFMSEVVDHYVDAHRQGLTPNPCVECNRKVKFDLFLDRAVALGFDAIATGHYAQVLQVDQRFGLYRAKDTNKDQSYVLHMLNQEQLSRCLLPLGGLTKRQVREHATRLNLRTASKPDSQDVCFIQNKDGRARFLGDRMEFHNGSLIETGTRKNLGEVKAIELVTIGQRKGMPPGKADERRYAVNVDIKTRTVEVGTETDLLASRVGVRNHVYTHSPLEDGAQIMVQTSAHGTAFAATFGSSGLEFHSPQRRIAPGQSVVFYSSSNEEVLGGAIAL